MGSYDHVRFKMDCPKCAKPLEGFQTKDGSCHFEDVDPLSAGITHFYTICDHCDEWVEFSRDIVVGDDVPVRTRAEVEAEGFVLSHHPTER